MLTNARPGVLIPKDQDPHRWDTDYRSDECLDGDGRKLMICERPTPPDNEISYRGDGYPLNEVNAKMFAALDDYPAFRKSTNAA